MRNRIDDFLGSASAEQRRLLRQGEELHQEAERLVRAIPVQPGWKALDVGCGPLGIIDILGDRVGPAGEVIGVERDPATAAVCGRQIARRQLPNAHVIAVDARATGLPAGAFDLVHARLLLINLPDPAPLLASMVELARPGGWVALQVVDAEWFVCDPPHPAWDRLRDVFLSVATAEGQDVWMGRHLGRLLRSDGLGDVEMDAHVPLAHPGEYYRSHLLSLIATVRDAILERGLLTAAELYRLVAETRHHLDQPDTIVLRLMLFQARGRKPVA